METRNVWTRRMTGIKQFLWLTATDPEEINIGSITKEKYAATVIASTMKIQF